MAIERTIMAEGLQSSDSNIPASGSQSSEQGISPVEPNVVVSPDVRRAGILQRLLGRGPKIEVLVQPEKPKPSYTEEFDRTKLDQYTFKTEGIYSVAIDPKTGEEVAKIPIIAGGSVDDEEEDTSGESSIEGLTQNELDLFLENGQTMEMLEDAKSHMSVEAFKQIAKSKIKEIKRKKIEESLSPEEKAKKKNEEKDKKLKSLQEDLDKANTIPTGTDKEKLLVDLMKKNITREMNDLKGVENENLDTENLEFVASKERGLHIAKQIIKQEALVKAGRLSEVDWKALNGAYLDQKIHIEARRIVAGKMKNEVEVKDSEETRKTDQPVEVGLLKGIPSFADLETAYKSGEFAKMTADQKEVFKKQLAVYFKAAKDAGMLDELDSVLKSAWKQAKQGISKELGISKIMPTIDHEIQSVLGNITDLYTDRQWTDDGIANLASGFDSRTGRVLGVWDLYAAFAKERLTSAIHKKDINYEQGRPYIENADSTVAEFEIEADANDDEKRETYWRVVNGWYVEVTAKSEEEYKIAADSYIDRLQDISAAPDKVLQDAGQFVDQIMKSDGAKDATPEFLGFLKQLTWSIEARLGVYGADHSNELYHGEYYKRYMDYVNKDGLGPNRWLNLAKSLDGKVAAALWLMDNDPRWDVLFTMYGSRGQLADASHAQRTGPDGWGLHGQAMELLVEELVGVELKSKGWLDNVTKAGSKKDFVDNFNGLHLFGSVKEGEHGNAHLSVYEKYHNKKVKDGKFVADTAVGDGVITVNYEKDLPKDISEEIRRSFRLGRIQHQLEHYKEEIHNGKRPKLERKVKGKDKIIGYDPLKDNLTDLLDPRDKNFYEDEVRKAHKAVHLALEMYGAFGEKSKRGGGAFKTDEKVGPDGKKYQYFIPTHVSEKFVQTAVTMTKIKYANESAEVRTQKVNEAIKRASEELKANGYEAVLKDESGDPMMIKRPRENPKLKGEVLRNIITEDVITEEVPLDFYTATHHQFANWTGHTYWSYQEEDRHLLLSDSTINQAKAIRDGILRPEDADIWANQLIILDPTLKRVRRFAKNFEDRERKLTMAAVEDSYQTHWQIGRELHREFYPKFGTPTGEIGMYYGLQDFGGFRKMNESMRVMFGQDPDRFMRRGRRLLPDLHNPLSTYAEYLGRGTDGMMGVLQMMDSPVYRGAGSMALDKFSAQAEVAAKLFGALCGSRAQDGTYEEGLLLKPTNNSDKLREILGNVPESNSKEWTEPKNQNKVCYALIESLGRLKRYEQLFTVMESDIRNATGAFDLREVDVLLADKDGNLPKTVADMLDSAPESLNLTFSNNERADLSQTDLRKIITEGARMHTETEEALNKGFNIKGIDEQRSPNTGSGKHSALEFHNTFGDILAGIAKEELQEYERRKKEGLPLRDGPDLYEGEALIYSHIFDNIIYNVGNKKGERVKKNVGTGTIWRFIFTKLVPI